MVMMPVVKTIAHSLNMGAIQHRDVNGGSILLSHGNINIMLMGLGMAILHQFHSYSHNTLIFLHTHCNNMLQIAGKYKLFTIIE